MIPVVVEGSVPDTMPGTGKGTEKNCCCGSYDPETYAFFLQYTVSSCASCGDAAGRNRGSSPP